MFEKNLKKISSTNGPLAFLLRRIQRAPRSLDFVPISPATLALGSRCDISQSPDVVVLEPDLERLFDALHTPQWTQWLEREKTHLLYLNPSNPGLFERAVLWAMQRGLSLAADRTAPEFFDEARATAASLASYLRDFEDFGARTCRHILAHVNEWSELHTLDQLPFQNQPVCIVGAGPSLEKDLDLLQELQNRAWILSGGSAIPALKEAGIVPDFLIVVDSLESQLERARSYADLTCPALIAPRAHPGALDYIHGPRIHLSFEHPLLQRLERKAGLTCTPLDLGWSLTTAAVAATHNASHTLLLGCDLAFTGNCAYAGGHFASPDEERISLPSKNGGEISSRRTWQLERDFISEHARDHAYNSGAFGLDIPGWTNSCPNLPLLAKNASLPKPHVISPIELEGELDYLVNWVWDRIKFMAMSFEELMTDQSVKSQLSQMVRGDIARALEKEFANVAVG